MPAGSSSQAAPWDASLLATGNAAWENAQKCNAAHRLCGPAGIFFANHVPSLQRCSCANVALLRNTEFGKPFLFMVSLRLMAACFLFLPLSP